jgi:hypothetical protein
MATLNWSLTHRCDLAPYLLFVGFCPRVIDMEYGSALALARLPLTPPETGPTPSSVVVLLLQFEILTRLCHAPGQEGVWKTTPAIQSLVIANNAEKGSEGSDEAERLDEK